MFHPAFPFSELPPTFVRLLEVFEACGYAPTLKHPLVKEFIASNSEELEEKLDDKELAKLDAEELAKLEAATIELAAVNFPEPGVAKLILHLQCKMTWYCSRAVSLSILFE
jgi:tyrosine-protein phosphatase YwqE